jgi:hypothetical protein
MGSVGRVHGKPGGGPAAAKQADIDRIMKKSSIIIDVEQTKLEHAGLEGRCWALMALWVLMVAYYRESTKSTANLPTPMFWLKVLHQ